MTDNPRPIQKGDTVYFNHTPTSWGWETEAGIPYVVTMTRKGRTSNNGRYTSPDSIFVVRQDATDKKYRRHWQSTYRYNLLLPEEVPADLRAQWDDLIAKRTRAATEASDSAARLRARNKATEEANQDKLAAAPVYGPIVVGNSKWNRISDDRKPVGSTFTYWTTEHDEYGVLHIVHRTDWIGVTVERKGEYTRERFVYSWGISLGGTTYTQKQAQVLAESITLALDLIPTLGDPRPANDR